ncbi:redoxin domain-containing protein [Halobellus clavatus]|jgi:peroxiredoxin|uniref:Peroxiredoxin n=1 Tax=Halobellus clavatus TaxID=660517 RepID=A0A1H3GAC3_9EURY|nr:redoxin domain-containing protein [Halobellus clavatus]SDY00007.1 Peroxiredoxin [Halobellus clavatus]
MVDFEVVSLPEADNPDVGETAPDFTRPLVNEEYWTDASLSSVVAEGPTLLTFHPMDGAFPTTYIWNEFDDRGFADDVQVVGVSISSPYEHTALLEERAEGARLFSDPAADVAEAYGIEHDLDGMSGVTEPRPAVFLLEEDRTVQYAWVASEWPAFPEYDEIEAAIAEHV